MDVRKLTSDLSSGALQAAGSVAGKAVRTIISMVSVTLFVLGVYTSTGMYVVSGDGSGGALWFFAGILLILGVAIVGTVVLVSKSLPVAAVLTALEKLKLGSVAANLIFEKILKVSDDNDGYRLSERTERLPLKQAEERVTTVVEGLLNERASSRGIRAFFARKVQQGVLKAVSVVTLRELRKEDATHGGVSLVDVRNHIGPRADSMALELVSGFGKRSTMVVVGVVILLWILVFYLCVIRFVT